MANLKTVKRTFLRQHDSSDCGVACLRSIIRFYGGDATQEQLREFSGTDIQGTTLLGLCEAADKSGFDAEGFEAGIGDLAAHNMPTILHVVVEQNLQHYVVWYGLRQNRDIPGVRTHIIGDPARGIIELTDGELGEIWQSGKCLTLSPNDGFIKKADITLKKRKELLNLIRKDFGLLLTASALGLFMAVLGMAMAVFSQKLFDDILPSKNYTKLVAGLALVVVLLLARTGFEGLRGYVLLRQAKEFSNRVNSYLYETVLDLPMRFFDRRKIGDILSRINDTSRIQQVISHVAGQVVVDLLIIIVSICFLFLYSWKIALGLVIAVPVNFIIVYWLQYPVIEAQRQLMIYHSLRESMLIDTVSGIRAIKSLNQQTAFGNRNKDAHTDYQESIWKLGKLQLRLNLCISACGVIVIAGVMAYCSYMMLQGTLKVGGFMAIVSLSSALLPSVVSIALFLIPINDAKIAFDRMFEMSGISLEKAVGTNETAPFVFQTIQLRNITYGFPGGRVILDNLSLGLKRGEILGLIGETGSGKSTLLQLLARFYQPGSGAIVLDGKDIEATPLGFWRENVAYIPQDVHIFNGTVLDNILFGFEMNSRSIDQFFNQEPYLSLLNKFPFGINTLIGEEGLNVSGGQRQWIGIMRTLIRKPKVLLLDEVTSAMDLVNEQGFQQVCQKIKGETTVVYVSHRLHTLADFCDRICILGAGKVLMSGSHSELLESDNIYSQFWQNLNLVSADTSSNNLHPLSQIS